MLLTARPNTDCSRRPHPHLTSHSPQSFRVDPSSPGKAGEQITVLRVIEVLPPVLVLHLKRISYDEATGGSVKTSKPIQLFPGLEIPSGTISSFIFPHGSKAENLSWLSRFRYDGTHCWTTRMAGALHTVWSALRGDVRLRVDDETVSMLRHEDVFGRHEDERVDDQCACLLFSSYRRTASPDMMT